MQQNQVKRNNLELVNYIGFIFLIIFFIIIISFFAQVKTYADQIPTEEKIKEVLTDKGENSKIYDRNGVLLYTFKDPDMDREYIEYEKIPPVVIASVLAAEDKDFYVHEGIDFIGMVKGAATTIASQGENTVGGSTVTQQLVKQTLLSDERTVDRKMKESMVTLFIERDYTKEQIMEYYLNITNYGGRITGINTASLTYFNKEVEKLNLNEAAFLVGLVQSPSEYSPLFSSNKENAKKLAEKRRKEILDQIINNPRIIAYLNSDDINYVHKKSYEKVDPTAGKENPVYSKTKLEQLKQARFEFHPSKEVLKAPHWVFYIKSLLSSEPYNLSSKDLYSKGYKIYTSLDIRIQELAEQKIKEGVDSVGSIYGFENSALVSMDARNGEVLAMVGSKGYYLKNDPNNRRFDPQVNVTLSKQPLGSSLKPFVYYLGFESGKYGPGSIIKDSPQVFYGYYKPKNFDGRFYGSMTIRKALLDSRNLPAIKMLYWLGDWRLNEFMEKVGYQKNKEKPYGLAAAVGGVDETLLDHVGAYTGLANGGHVKKAKPVMKILNNEEKVIYKGTNKTIYELNSNAVAMVNNILGDKGYTPGTYGYKFIGGEQLAGKTGTSDSNKDTYYMGYGPKVVTGVWCGNNNNDRMSSRALGSTTALLVWNGYMREFFTKFSEYGTIGRY